MKPGAGSHKGSAFERQVAKLLSRWITDGKDDTQLIRSVLSGGWRYGQRRGAEAFLQVGDLAANGEAGKEFRKRFAVECKHRQDINLYSIWTQLPGEANLIGWWRKLVHDSLESDTQPLLVFRSNRMPIMIGCKSAVMGSEESLDMIGLLPGSMYLQFEDLLIHPLSDFLALNSSMFI